MLAEGVRENPDVDALATRSDREAAVMIWNYHDVDQPAPEAAIELVVTGVPEAARRLLVRHYRIDQVRSNAYAAWKRMGSPQSPTSDQYAQLEAAGQLEAFESPRWLDVQERKVKVAFPLPRHSVSLLQFSW